MTYWLYQRAGAQVTLHAETEQAQTLLENAFVGLKLQATKEIKGVLLTVGQAQELWTIHDASSGQTWRYDNELLGDVIYMLSDRLIHHIADTANQAHCFHAAAVGYKNKAVIIPADSGSGKSSFTCWMVQAGFSYLTDELVLLKKNKQLQGVSRPIQIKPHGIEVIKPMLDKPDLEYAGKMANAITIERLGGTIESQDVLDAGIFIFPKYDADYEFDFVPLSPAQTGMKLMSGHINARNLEDHGFRESMKLAREIPSYTLNYGGFDKLPSDFAEQIKTLLENA